MKGRQPIVALMPTTSKMTNNVRTMSRILPSFFMCNYFLRFEFVWRRVQLFTRERCLSTRATLLRLKNGCYQDDAAWQRWVTKTTLALFRFRFCCRFLWHGFLGCRLVRSWFRCNFRGWVWRRLAG